VSSASSEAAGGDGGDTFARPAWPNSTGGHAPAQGHPRGADAATVVADPASKALGALSDKRVLNPLLKPLEEPSGEPLAGGDRLFPNLSRVFGGGGGGFEGPRIGRDDSTGRASSHGRGGGGGGSAKGSKERGGSTSLPRRCPDGIRLETVGPMASTHAPPGNGSSSPSPSSRPSPPTSGPRPGPYGAAVGGQDEALWAAFDAAAALLLVWRRHCSKVRRLTHCVASATKRIRLIASSCTCWEAYASLNISRWSYLVAVAFGCWQDSVGASELLVTLPSLLRELGYSDSDADSAANAFKGHADAVRAQTRPSRHPGTPTR
jgi:hypothetical protein